MSQILCKLCQIVWGSSCTCATRGNEPALRHCLSACLASRPRCRPGTTMGVILDIFLGRPLIFGSQGALLAPEFGILVPIGPSRSVFKQRSFISCELDFQGPLISFSKFILKCPLTFKSFILCKICLSLGLGWVGHSVCQSV